MSFQKNIFAAYSAQIISVLCAFLCSIMAARMLGTDGQGQLSLFVNFSLLAALILSFGLPPALVYFKAAGKLAARDLLSILFALLLIASLFLGLSLYIISRVNSGLQILPHLIFSSPTWIVFILIYILIVLSNGFFAAILQSESAFQRAGLISMLGSGILLLIYLLRYFSFAGSDIPALSWILMAMIIHQLSMMFLYLQNIYRIQPACFQLSFVKVKSLIPLFRFAALAFSTNLIQFLSYKMDTWLVNYYQGSSETGIYTLAVSLSQMIWLLPSAVQSVLFSFLSGVHDAETKLQRTFKMTRQLGLYSVVAGLTGFLLAQLMLPCLFGTDFTRSITCIGILLIGMVPFCLTFPISAYFAARGRIKLNLISAILGFIVCLVADLVLIPQYGILGASVASGLSYLTTTLFLFAMFRKQSSPSLRSSG